MTKPVPCLKAAAAALFCALVALWCVFVTGCGYAKHNDPKLYLESSAAAAQEAARLHARDIGGNYHQNKCCGSMEPLIYAGDWIVTKRETYGDHLLGKPVVYIYTPTNQRMLHRLVSKDGDGFLGSGDNNPRTESWARINKDNYISTVIAIYRVDTDQ